VGLQAKLPVYAESVDDVVGVSFTLSLPEGVTIATDESGELVYELNSERMSSKQFNVTAMANGDQSWGFRISPATKTAVMKEGDGEIMTITLRIAEDIEIGDHDVMLTENKLAIRSGEDMVESLEVDDRQATLNVSVLMGDVNCDGEVDLSDAIMVIYYSLKAEPSLFKAFAADMNGDGTIDLADAIIIIYMALDAQEDGNMARAYDTAVTDESAVNSAWLEERDGRTALLLDNGTAFVGMQCDITLPKGATLSDLQINGSRCDGHQIVYNQTAADSYRVMIYPSKAKAFTGHSGSLLSFALKGRQGAVKVENIFFVDTRQRKHSFADLSNESTGIGGIVSQEQQSEPFIDLQGRRMEGQPRKGIYMQGGRKVVVK
jgi:hypothetical protein